MIIIHDNEGNSKGRGYVEFENEHQAECAIEFDQHIFKERKLFIQYARPIEKNNFIIEIPINIVLEGSVETILINNIKYRIQIKKGTKENTKYEINNTIYEIKYQENNHYRREGNDLIGSFVYAKEHDGKIIPMPYPIENKLHYQCVLLNSFYIMDGFGFYDEENECYGNTNS